MSFSEINSVIAECDIHLSSKDLNLQRKLNTKVRKLVKKYLPDYNIGYNVRENGSVDDYRLDTKYMLKQLRKCVKI